MVLEQQKLVQNMQLPANLSAQNIQRRGYDQSLWLDPIEMKYIEELSGMNFFILENNELHTPKLNNSFLAGITRDSLITLAKYKGYDCNRERYTHSEGTKWYKIWICK